MKLDHSIAAIVSGGASGLGEATARALSAEGVKVTIFDLNPDRGSAVAREIGGHFVEVNVADDASVASGVAEAEARHGIARIAVNCAGVAPAAKTVAKGGRAALAGWFSQGHRDQPDRNLQRDVESRRSARECKPPR